MVPADVVHPRLLYHGPYPRLPEVLDLVLVRGREVRAHGPVVSRDHHAAPARRLLLVDPVLDVDALLFALLAKCLGVLVRAHATHVPDAVGREHVRGTPRGVLGGAAGDDLGVAVLQQVVVQGHVLGFGEDGVVEFEVVLFEHLVVARRRSEDVLENLRQPLEGQCRCSRVGGERLYPFPWISG